ncbi:MULTISPECIES: hypothetical protein [unclassified Bradyrhizobium]|uniref:hypothetical protein n=2 Tax=unclassified Bradyrhizobium TaxID=2631580 RepID=UPI001FFB55DD|nr:MULTISPECIES: hypothetical protein [unclassified Bradyrhizobium]MCK1299638.1 hypothetical protein [Bradyrhizobium sp. 37]MCK1768692.1 hypothetical protein [Bradyrhizobium sp. 134]
MSGRQKGNLKINPQESCKLFSSVQTPIKEVNTTADDLSTPAAVDLDATSTFWKFVTERKTHMDIDEEDGDFESTSLTYEVANGPDLIREVRWFSSSHNAYRWSESGDRWIFLDECRSLNYAVYLAEKDIRSSDHEPED